MHIQPDNGILNMGCILIQEQAQKTFTIQNISNFPIQYQLKSEKQGVQNIDGSRVCFKIHRSSPSSPPRARSRPSPSKT